MLPDLKTTFIAATTIACAVVTAAHAAVTISNAKTKNMNCAGGVCVPTGKKANLNVGDLVTLLASSDVTVKSKASVPDIGVIDALTWTSAHRLTLDAYGSIHVRAPVVVEGTSGLTLTTNDGGSGGDYNFVAATSGSVTFWDLSSRLTINGRSYALKGDIATLASAIAGNPSGNFALASSYDASVDGAYHHVPIETVFTGAFEGLGNTISNLSLSLPSVPLVGLFAQSGGSLRDIALTNVDYAAQNNGNTIIGGALVGENDGTVSYASATGAMNGGVTAGGLIGINKGPVAYCSSSVIGTIGGLAASNYSSITQSFATADTTGIVAGGLVNYNDDAGSISLSYATGNVTSASSNRYGRAGGLAAVSYGTITQSFATGIATAANGKSTAAGGLIGYLGNGLVLQSYATGAVNSGKQSSIGGLVGEVAPKAAIQQSFSTGAVTIGKSRFAGGALGWDHSAGQKLSALYWDLDTSGIADPTRGAGAPRNDPGITGLTDTQLKSALPAGFDPNVWGQKPNINNGYPYLLANPPP